MLHNEKLKGAENYIKKAKSMQLLNVADYLEYFLWIICND